MNTFESEMGNNTVHIWGETRYGAPIEFYAVRIPEDQMCKYDELYYYYLSNGDLALVVLTID